MIVRADTVSLLRLDTRKILRIPVKQIQKNGVSVREVQSARKNGHQN